MVGGLIRFPLMYGRSQALLNHFIALKAACRYRGLF